MIASGIQPTVVGYTSAVSALAHCGEVELALELLHEMKEEAGIEPNEQVGSVENNGTRSVNYVSLILMRSCLCSAGGLRVSRDSFEARINLWHPYGDFSSDVQRKQPLVWRT